MIRAGTFVLALAAGFAAGAAMATAGGDKPKARKITVTATAYNALEEQTDAEPHIGAWGDHLDRAVKPGLRVIAVSPDLLQKGLRRGQRVKIRGLKGEFVVLDKMPRRWTNHIDIYMHKDVSGARRWGRRRVTLLWNEP